MKIALRQVAQTNAGHNSGDAQQRRLAEDDAARCRPLDAPRDFSTPISRVRSMMVVYIERKITRKPMTTAMPIITLMKRAETREIRGGHQRHEILQRPNLITRQKLLDLILTAGV